MLDHHPPARGRLWREKENAERADESEAQSNHHAQYGTGTSPGPSPRRAGGQPRANHSDCCLARAPAKSHSRSRSRFRVWSCLRTSRRTPCLNVARRTRGSLFHSKTLTCVNCVPVAAGVSRYSTLNTDASSSSRIVSRVGGSDSRCSTTSSAGARSGAGLWSTLQRRGPAASTALTLRHHRGSFTDPRQKPTPARGRARRRWTPQSASPHRKPRPRRSATTRRHAAYSLARCCFRVPADSARRSRSAATREQQQPAASSRARRGLPGSPELFRSSAAFRCGVMRASGPSESRARHREFVWAGPAGAREKECRQGHERSPGMTLIILSAAAVATTLPCLLVWVADTARRPDED